MKKILFSTLCILGMTTLLSATDINAATTFDGDTAVYANYTSGYSYATDGSSSKVSMTSTYLLSSHTELNVVQDSLSGGYPTIKRDLPRNGAYFTKVDGTHTFFGGGKVTYSHHVR